MLCVMPLLLMLLLDQQQLRLPHARLACRYSSRGISTCSSYCSVQRARAFGNTTAIAATLLNDNSSSRRQRAPHTAHRMLATWLPAVY
jgi:hypothetical protein